MSHYYPDWMRDAACAEVGGDVWFPEPGDLTWRSARQVCAGCTAFHSCLDWIMTAELGLSNHSRFGITAGMSPLQRERYEPQWLAEQEGEVA